MKTLSRNHTEAAKTVETVFCCSVPFITGLKPGVNEMTLRQGGA